MIFATTMSAGKFFRVVAVSAFISSAAIASAGTHTVKKGDTLYRVATENGMTVEELSKLNGLSKSSGLSVGQSIAVKDKAGASQTLSKSSKQVTHQKTVVRETLSPRSSKKLANRGVITKNSQRGRNNVFTQTKALPVPATTDERTPFSGRLQIASSSAMVVDAATGRMLFSKNAGDTKPIASITKLMTAMVSLDANPSMDEVLQITEADVDHLKQTSSRLPVGTRLTRYEMLRLALMSSENRASSALARNYPGGKTAFIAAMNSKASKLGMTHSQFEDSTGLTPHNIATAEDLVKMVQAASQYSLIHEFTTTPGREVALRPHSTPLQYKNSNVLIREPSDWDITVSKTGYTQEAGRCLVMMATVAQRPAVMVFLESEGKLSPVGDANRIKDWIESGKSGVTVAAR
jgi:D-alanyl-D-alanine endopeptidase (penicillin-binding protein 7)